MNVNLVSLWVVRMIGPLAASLILNVAAQAQTSRGTVSGTVMDPSGAIIAGAGVALTNIQTGVRLEGAANEAGIYRFDAVDLGTYELRINHPGFTVFLATGLSVEANRTTVMDVRLKVGV